MKLILFKFELEKKIKIYLYLKLNIIYKKRHIRKILFLGLPKNCVGFSNFDIRLPK